MNIPTIISFYTDDEVYRPAIERLKASLDNFGLSYDIVCVADRGTWTANCSYKAEFILSMLEDYIPFNLIWLDADAEVVRYPELFDRIEGDIAAVVNQHGLFASAIYFHNTKEVRNLVTDWVQAIKDNPGEFTDDQINLERVIKAQSKVVFEELPPEYSFITDVMKPVEHPVIIQHQASRQGRILHGV